MKKTSFQKIFKPLSIIVLMIALSTTPTMASPWFGTEKIYVCSQVDANGDLVDVYDCKTYIFGIEVEQHMEFEFADPVAREH